MAPDLLKKANRIGTVLLQDGFPVEGVVPAPTFKNSLYTVGEWTTEITEGMSNLAEDIEQARTDGRLPSN